MVAEAYRGSIAKFNVFNHDEIFGKHRSTQANIARAEFMQIGKFPTTRLFGTWLEFFAVAEPHGSADRITYSKMRLSDSELSSASRDVIPKRSFISPGRNARCSMRGKMRYTYTTCSASSGKLFSLSKRKNPMGENCAMKAKDPVSSFVTIWVLQPLAAHTKAKSLSNLSGLISQFSPTHRSGCEMAVCSRRIYSGRNESEGGG